PSSCAVYCTAGPRRGMGSLPAVRAGERPPPAAVRLGGLFPFARDRPFRRSRPRSRLQPPGAARLVVFLGRRWDVPRMDPITLLVVVLVVALLGFIAGIAFGVHRHRQQRRREDQQDREARRSW